MAILVRVEELARDVPGRTDTMLDPGDAYPHALAILITPIEGCRVGAAVAVLRAVAGSLRQRRGELVRPGRQLV